MEFFDLISAIVLFFVNFGNFLRGEGDDEVARGVLGLIEKTLNEIKK